MIRTLKGCQTERRILHPSGVRQSMRGDPVVSAALRPPATFCITLRVKYEKTKGRYRNSFPVAPFSVYCLLSTVCCLLSTALLRKAVAEFARDDERLDHVSLFKVAVEVV